MPVAGGRCGRRWWYRCRMQCGSRRGPDVALTSFRT
jgi:hypothetical protein